MDQLTTIDLGFQGFSEVIAAYAAPTGDGRFVLIESGPAISVDAVEQGVAALDLALDDLAAIFVTHVHLDHSGGAGVLARKTGCRVYSHPAGAAHLIDPGSKLLPSAERLYGDMLEPLWGRTEPVPSRQLTTVEHGAAVAIGGLEARAWHTPGHAAHHIAWQIGGDVVTGDVGGIRFPGADYVAPPTPPPDIDIDAWRRSLDLLRGLEPKRLLLIHYGAFDDPERHLDELEARLLRWAAVAETTVAEGGDLKAVGLAIRDLDEPEIAAHDLPEDTLARYSRLCPVVENSAGLYRWAVKRAAG